MSEDQIDPDISRWILEFFIRKPIKDHIFNSLVRVLPISDTNFSLKKLLLLRRLEFEVSNCVISEKVLQLLEQIYELDQILGSKDYDQNLNLGSKGCGRILGDKDCDKRSGSKECNQMLGNKEFDQSLGTTDYDRVLGGRDCNQILCSKDNQNMCSKDGDENLGSKDCCELLKKAYCAVAVECTVGCLKNGNNDVKGEFFDVVKRIWRGRVREMERVDVRLVSKALLEWRDDIEAAIWEESICLKVVERSKEIDAREAVRVYLNEEEERMGPSFLELASETLKSKDGGFGGGVCLREMDESGQCGSKDGEAPEYDNNARTFDKGKALLVGPSGSCHLLGTPEVEMAKEALQSSRLELHAAVKDPLPDALRLAESAISEMNVANKDLTPADQNLELLGGQNRGDKSGERDVGVENMDFQYPGDQNRIKSGESNAGNSTCSGKTNAPKGLMERNKTARTFEWDDSIDCSNEELSESISRPHLHSPRGSRVSPLNLYKEQNLKKRRKKKRWSTVEEDTLRAGVQKFGRGHWKLILYAYCDIFEERTEVDLKDKWRNMTQRTREWR